MFKTVITLVKGGSAAIVEEIEERSAFVMLDQQMRDAASAYERAKRALALAIAQDHGEGRRVGTVMAQLADLEQRATAALAAGREDLAREAAEMIALLEADRDAALEQRTLFAAEIARLKEHVGTARLRLADLDRGRRVARASEAVRMLRRGRAQASRLHEASLADAELTLRRLRERQLEAQAAEDAMDMIDEVAAPLAVSVRLPANGLGAPLRRTAEDVLARLKAAATRDV